MTAGFDCREGGTKQYAAYLETTLGKLRLDLAWEHLAEFLSDSGSEPAGQALDLGAGTGAFSRRLRAHGFHVTLLDNSSEILAVAERELRTPGDASRIRLLCGDACALPPECAASSYDVVVCHNVLEFVADPRLIVKSISHCLKLAGGVASILVRNRAGEVLKAALRSGDIRAAEKNLTAERVRESLFGNEARLFTADELRRLASEASLEILAERGIRVAADYLAASVLDALPYPELLAFERRLGAMSAFAAVARYTQVLVRLNRAKPFPSASGALA